MLYKSRIVAAARASVQRPLTQAELQGLAVQARDSWNKLEGKSAQGGMYIDWQQRPKSNTDCRRAARDRHSSPNGAGVAEHTQC